MNDYEAGDRYFEVAKLGEQQVFQTTRRWRAVDVYVTMPFFVPSLVGSDCLGTVRVYSVVRGQRSLVGVGRVSQMQIENDSIWVCAVRTEAELFEVTWQSDMINTTPTPAGQQAPQMRVVVVASDEAVDAPRDLGCQPWTFRNAGNAAAMTSAAGQVFSPAAGNFWYEIIGVMAFNRVASPRALAIQPGPGATFLALFGMPFQGSPVYENGESKLPYLGNAGNSATSEVSIVKADLTAGAAGDVEWQVWWR